MRIHKTLFRLILTLVLLLPQSIAWAISKEMQDLVHSETRINAIGLHLEARGQSTPRHTRAIELEHFEIPLEIMEKRVALRANPDYVSSLVFERDGKKFVRWVLNPEDTKWHHEVETFLKNNNLSTQRHKYFLGYMTASRSYIVVDPKTSAEFSLKMSTDHTGGHWADKKQTWSDAAQIRRVTDYVYEQLRSQPRLQNIILLDEAIAFGITKGVNQGMVVRSYEGLSHSGKRYIPGFSIMHSEFGERLAKENGSNNPAEFWNEHYNKPLARALAEFAALTGMAYDSPHSQNFLVELDAKNRPTGKIVLRDFGDTYLTKEFFEVAGKEGILKIWPKKNIISGQLHMSVGILHGNIAPAWIDRLAQTGNARSYNQWGADFFAAFEAEFLRQTGVDLNKGQVVRNSVVVDAVKKIRAPGNYFSRNYNITDSKGQEFLALVAKGEQRNALHVNSCGRVLFAM